MSSTLLKKSLILPLLVLTACDLFKPDQGVGQTYTFFSRSLDASATVAVYYPESYDASTPVIYLLNGWGTDAFAWGSGMDLASEAQKRDLLFVSLSAGSHTYTNSSATSNQNYADYVLEVVSKVEREWDIDIEYDQRALCGISNGGGGALFILSEYPESFAGCGCLSGNPYSGMLNYANFEDRAVRIDVGTEDGVLTQLRWLHNKLDEEGIEHEYYEHPGQHDWDFWEKYAPIQFDFLEALISD